MQSVNKENRRQPPLSWSKPIDSRWPKRSAIAVPPYRTNFSGIWPSWGQRLHWLSGRISNFGSMLNLLCLWVWGQACGSGVRHDFLIFMRLSSSTKSICQAWYLSTKHLSKPRYRGRYVFIHYWYSTHTETTGGITVTERNQNVDRTVQLIFSI